MSLFIENIFEVASHEVKAPSDASNPKALVANVLEKKALIEKLQEKMNQRLDIINNLLASHTMIQSTQNTSTAPNIMKSNVKMVNLNFGNHLSLICRKLEIQLKLLQQQAQWKPTRLV